MALFSVYDFEINVKYMITAPINSSAIVTSTTFFIKFIISSLFDSPTTLCMIDSLLKLIFCPIIIAKALDMVIMPNPPICISVRIIICPNNVKCNPVSYTISPVTQVAEVEVNTAPRKPLRALLYQDRCV